MALLRQIGWICSLFSHPAPINDFFNIYLHSVGTVDHATPFAQTMVCGFDPHTESISKLDLWIRIHKFSSEYANFDAPSAILKLNKFGTMIRHDPLHDNI
ncbi:hypothetical protein V2J09_005933 [Rumex salicifolius]